MRVKNAQCNEIKGGMAQEEGRSDGVGAALATPNLSARRDAAVLWGMGGGVGPMGPSQGIPGALRTDKGCF